MNEIPYVNQLGDAFDDAIARRSRVPRLRRLGRRRYLAVALAALAIGGGGAAAAGLFTDPVEIGFGATACYQKTDPSGDVAIITDPTRSPVDLCGAALPNDGLEARDLIACQWPGHGVVVVLRGDLGGCTHRGLAPVPASYTDARKRAVRLQSTVTAFERRVDCLAPRPFASRLQALLRGRGWAGWRVVVRGGDGPCSRVSSMGGTDARSIAGYVNGEHMTIAVRRAPPFAIENVIFGSESPGVSLFHSSGERCFTVAGLQQHVRKVLAPAGLPLRFTLGPMPPNTGTEPPRGDRYAEGCAIYVGAYPSYHGGPGEIVVELRQRDASG